ncbi:MAG: hypothetical protein ABJB74_01980 [Gemmatimonas sp.]
MIRYRRCSRFVALPLLACALGTLRGEAQLRVQETSLGIRAADTVSGTFTFSRALDVAYIQKVARGEQVVVNGVAGAVFASIPRVRLSEAGRVSSISFSPNGKRVAYVAISNGKTVMVVDGVAGAPFDFIPVGSAFFSPDSRRVTYVAKRGDRNYVITDGRESAPYDEIDMRYARFTSDSKHVIYTATLGARHVVVYDDKEIARAEYVGDPVFSKTGNRLAYVQMNNDAWAVVVDGVAGKSYRSIGNNLIFSDDESHFLYRGRDSLDHVVVDGVERVNARSIRGNSYALSSDGKHVAFVAQDGGRDRWVLDGVPQTTYDWVSGDAAFSADGRTLTYVAELERKRFVVIGANEGERFDDITEFPKFTANNHVLFVAKRGEQHYVVIDSQGAAYDQVSETFIAPSGKAVTVAKRGATWSVYIDGKPGALYDEAPNSLTISDDGQHLAFTGGRDGKRFVCIDNNETQLFDNVRVLSFSPDGKHLAFIASRGRHELLVLDGVESTTYDQVMWLERSSLLSPNSLSFLARRGPADVRVTVDWNAAATRR